MAIKLNEEQRKEIIAKICKDYNITKQYIFKLAKSDIAKENKHIEVISHE